ncbi:UNVERIFIED_CONTAM: hypothetical protein FKN15_055746 [Acipenser sinensis]
MTNFRFRPIIELARPCEGVPPTLLNALPGREVFQIAYVIIKAANSPRPGNWILERSMDGDTFEPWQYFAITDTECLTRFNILPRTGPPSYTKDDDVICTSYYSKIHPLENGELAAYGGKLIYTVSYDIVGVDKAVQATTHTDVIIESSSHSNVLHPEQGTMELIYFTLFLFLAPIFAQNQRRSFSPTCYLDTTGELICDRCPPGYTGPRCDRISEISMEVAEEGQSTFESERAYQIEKCECPPGYSGLSCEECASGYYRLSSRVSGRASSSGIGSCVRCQCNGHSEMCDPETSICQNCRHNTFGDRCEQCASGFYGVVRGSPDDCRPCTCPLPIPSNNFSPTCVMEGFHDFRCTACPSGYEGQYCERCSPGFYGDPRSPGGSCQECKCDPNGSLPLPCDQLTGQCQCKQGTTGLACERCMERHVCEATQIIFCDDECTGLLLNDLDSLGRMVMSVNLTGPLPPPYKVLYRFENMTQELKHLLSPQRAPERLLQLADSNLGTLVTEMDELLSRATKVSADGEQTNADAERTRKRAEDLDKFVKNSLQAAEALKEKARKLNETLGSRDGVLEKSLQEMHTDIEKMLAELRRRKLGKHQQIADEELGAADALLTKVKKLFGDPHQATEDLKLEVTDKLADYKTKLDDAQALLAEAKGKIREANHLSADNQRNMTALEKMKQAVNGGKKDTEGILAEGESILGEASRLLDDINQEIEDLEEIGRNIGPLRAQLKYKVEELTEGLTENNLPELVLQAENHAAQLNDSSSILDGILAEAKNLSFNATAAFKAYSNIKDSIEEAEKIAKQAKASATEAVQLSDFLAIEMRKGKVNFLWDVGSGVGRVEYPDITISDQNWYRIEASRIGRNGTISVHALEGPKAGIMPSTFSGVSPEGYTILDVDADAYLFVGGLTSKIKKADAVKTTTFSGCMGETYLDSKPIGLWNYRERQGNCKGCVVSPQPPDTEGTMQFDGEGYAAVSRPTRWNPNVSTVMFKFRTFSTNALLMYFATKDMVVVTKMWCSNDFFSFTANVAIVDIDTNKEEKIETVSGGTSSGLNLKDNERIYFGGLPTLRNFRAEVTLKKFAGCLKDIEVSRTPYNLLSSTDYTGLTKGCSIENIHTVSFPKPGFVELNPFSLDVGTEISFSFSTQNDTGIILFGSGGAPAPPRRKRRQTSQPYAAVFLHKGRLEVVIFIGTRDPRRVMMKPEEGILHDGREHSIRIERTRGKFTVQVDEENRLEQRLPNDQSINIKKLFVGGIPSYVQASMLRSINPFEGCIWNLVINTLPVDFAQTLSFENAEIGQCPTLAPPPKPLPEEEIDEVTEAPEQSQPKPAVTTKPIVRQPATPAPVTCAAETEPVTLLNAKQFGLSRNSHVAMAFDDTKVKSRKFTVQVDEENRLEQRLPNDQSINIKKLFVGGIPSYVQASMLRSINPFEGCIWNLVINTLPVDFAQTLSFENAEIGQCPTLAPPPKPLPEEEIDEVTEAPEQSQPKPAVTTKPIVRQPATPAPVTCAAETEPVTLLNAKQFGLSRNSHVAMAFDDTKVRVLRDKQRGILTVDGRYSSQTTSPKKADILDVVGMVYIGGVPVNYTIRRIGPVVYSINACIRNFKMLNSALDLDNPTSSYNVGTCFVNAQTGTYFNGTGYAKTGISKSIKRKKKEKQTNLFKRNKSALDLDNPTSSYNVGTCFVNAQTGTYFNGTGYAKTVGAYKVGTDLSIELEFRTSQRSGVLLGISDQKMDGLGIELVNGKMLFHADNGVGRFTATYETDSQGGLCDGQWHRVVATKLKHRLELTVDDKKVEGQSPNAHSASADTNDPVFVGGYPDGLKQFGLTINTPFKGCIRNLKLTKGPKPQEINFSKALELQGVQPMTCPAN